MPTKFKAADGRSYVLSLTFGHARKLQQAMAIDITTQRDWTQLMESMLDRLACIATLVGDQVTANGLTVDDFIETLADQAAAEAASESLIDEMLFFYRKYGMPELATLTEKQRQMVQEAKAKFRSSDFQQRLDNEIAKVLNNGAQLLS